MPVDELNVDRETAMKQFVFWTAAAVIGVFVVSIVL
ncbi:MAG: hypothetical protein J07HX64_02710 [halophilic archaeon J07HX64]|nr:MAG: hypothetical protein J07HX64_02710 [halophilic archaeon J07HX64]